MGLRSTIASAVNGAFNAIGDLVEQVTYKSITGTNYDSATGNVTTTLSTVILKRTVFYDFEQKEVDNDIVVLKDMKFIFPTADLGGLIPKSQDIFTDSLNRTWEVQRLLGVPGDSVTILHVRTSR